MTETSSKPNPFFNLLSKGFFGLIVLLLLFFGVSYYVANFNSPFVANQIIERLEKKLNVNLGFSEYHISEFGDFPFVTLVFNDLFIEGSNLPKDNLELLRINKLSIRLDPIKLLQQEYSIEYIYIDDVSIHIYKDTLGQSNLDFLQKIKSSNNKNTSTSELDFVPITIRNFDFDYTDNYRNKTYQVFFPHALLTNTILKDKRQFIQLEAKCQFKGLRFNNKNGAFLKNKKAFLNLNIEVDSTRSVFQISDSYLDIEKQIFKINGLLKQDSNNHLTLNIQNDKTYLAHVLPLLSSNIQFALRDFKINKTIDVNFLLDGSVIPGQSIPMQVDFSSKNTRLVYRDVKMTQASFVGQYKNRCSNNQKINANSGCVKVRYLHGNLLGTMPTQLSGVLTNLRDPNVQLNAKIDAELSALNELIPIEQKIDINQGNAKFRFHYNGPVKDLNISAIKRGKIRLDGTLDFNDITINLGQKDFALHDISGQAIFNEKTIQLHQIKTLFSDTKMELNGELMNFTNFLFGKNKALEADLKVQFDQINIKDFLSIDNSQQSIYKTNKPNKNLPGDQVSRLALMLNDKLKGKLSVAINSILYDTLFISDVQFDINLKNPCTDLTDCKPILSIPNFKAIFLDQIPLEANLLLDQMDNPLLHIDLSTRANLKQLHQFLPKDQLALTSGFFDLNLKANASINSFSDSQKFFQDVEYLTKIKLNNVATTYTPQEIAIKKLHGDFSFDKEKLLIENCSFSYNQNQYSLLGNIYNYVPQVLGKDSIMRIDLALSMDSLYINNIKFTNNANNKDTSQSPSLWLQSLMQISKTINGQLKINIAELKIPKYPLSDLSFTSFLNAENEEKKPVFIIKDFRTKLKNKTPLIAELEIDKFSKPKLKSKIKSIIPVRELRNIFPSDYFSFHSGNLSLHIDYLVDLQDSISAENYILNSTIDGTLKFLNAHIDYKERGFSFQEINGELRFDEKALYIDSLDLVLNENAISATGHSSDFFPFFILANQKVQINLETKVSKFDFENFTTPFNLGVDPTLPTKKKELVKMEYIDQLLEKGIINLKTEIGQAVYHDFKPTSIKGAVLLQSNLVQLQNMKMKIADGDFRIDGQINNISNYAPKADVRVAFTDNDISKVFKAFENFGQSDLTFENIFGRASANINFKADINDNYEVNQNSILGKVNLLVSEGQLVDFPALKKLTGFLFKKRGLENIAIDTIQTNIHLKGNHLLLDHFELHSTSFDFGVSGLYSLGDDDASQIFFEVPLSNLFKKQVQKEALAHKKSRRKGLKIFIQGKEKNDKLKFSWSIFRKKKKRKILNKD